MDITVGSTHNISAQRRATLLKEFDLKTAAGDAFDLSTYDVYAEVRRKDGGVLVLNLAPVVADPATDGTVNIEIDIPESITSGEYQWDLLLVAADDVKTYAISGRFVVTSSITDPSF